jgi:hypothetical protein
MKDLRSSQWWCWKFGSSRMWSSISGFVAHAVSKGLSSFIFRVKQYKTTEKKALWSLKRVGNYKPSDIASSPRTENSVPTIASVVMLVCWDLHFYWWVNWPATFWKIFISKTQWVKHTQYCICIRCKQRVSRHSTPIIGNTPLLNSEYQLLEFCSLFPLWKEIFTLQRLLQQLCLIFYAKNEAQALLYHVVLWQWCNMCNVILNYFQCSLKYAILGRSKNCRGQCFFLIIFHCCYLHIHLN